MDGEPDGSIMDAAPDDEPLVWLRAILVPIIPVAALAAFSYSMEFVNDRAPEPGFAAPGLAGLVLAGAALVVWSVMLLRDHPARSPLLALGAVMLALPWTAWLIRIQIGLYGWGENLFEMAFLGAEPPAVGFAIFGLLIGGTFTATAWTLQGAWLVLADVVRGAAGLTCLLVGGYFLATLPGQAEKAETAFENNFSIPGPELLLVGIGLILVARWVRRA